jgi:hypothetical protein
MQRLSAQSLRLGLERTTKPGSPHERVSGGGEALVTTAPGRASQKDR